MRRMIVGILRGFSPEDIEGIVPACVRGGLGFLEVTMNSAGACEQIALASQLAGEALQIGAGTVLNLCDLELALGAGARFIVTPVVNPEVIRACVQRKVPVFPGACSPSEVLAAWELGAAMVKVFPGGLAGSEYIRELKQSFPGIRLMPTGGVTLETIDRYAEAGADGYGVGGPLFDPGWIERRDWEWLEAQCRAFCG